MQTSVQVIILIIVSIPIILTVSPPQTIMAMIENAPPFVMTALVPKVWAGEVFVHRMVGLNIGLDSLISQ